MTFTIDDFHDLESTVVEAQLRTECQLGRIQGCFDRIDVHLDHLCRSALERRYRQRAAVYFRRVVRRPIALSTQQLVDLVDGPAADVSLSDDERDQVLLADLVVRGRAESGEGDVYLVVEVSVGIGKHDVERAAQRAELLGRMHVTLAVVAGEWIAEEAERLAEARGVWRVLAGRARMPEVRAG